MYLLNAATGIMPLIYLAMSSIGTGSRRPSSVASPPGRACSSARSAAHAARRREACLTENSETDTFRPIRMFAHKRLEIILVEVFFLKNLVSNEPGTTYCAHLTHTHTSLKMFVMKEVLKKKSYETKYLRITEYFMLSKFLNFQPEESD